MHNTIVRLANRTLTIPASRVGSYLSRGYDEIDEQGNVIQRATGGKTVSIQEHNKALDKIEELEAKLAESGNASLVDDLKKENSVLKGKLTKAENELASKK